MPQPENDARVWILALHLTEPDYYILNEEGTERKMLTEEELEQDEVQFSDDTYYALFSGRPSYEEFAASKLGHVVNAIGKPGWEPDTGPWQGSASRLEGAIGSRALHNLQMTFTKYMEQVKSLLAGLGDDGIGTFGFNSEGYGMEIAVEPVLMTRDSKWQASGKWELGTN